MDNNNGNTIIVEMDFGSHLYGTDTDQSDRDYMRIHLPSARDIVLQRVQNTIAVRPRKPIGAKSGAGHVTMKSYSLQHYLELLCQGQTVALDMLFAPYSAIQESSSVWRLIQENKHKFLTKKSAVFLGYCKQQANKYGIKGSRVAAAEAAAKLFAFEYEGRGSRAKVKDLSKEIDILVSAYPEHIKVADQVTNKRGDIETYIDVCGRKIGFRNTVKEAATITQRISNEYGERARKAKSNEGVDWKALSHAVRVGYEAVELLTEHKITLPLPDADYIRDIKMGKYTYNDVSEVIETLMFQVEVCAQASDLPEEPDYTFAEDIVASMYGHVVKDWDISPRRWREARLSQVTPVPA